MQESRITSSSHLQIEHFPPSETMYTFGNFYNLTQARIWNARLKNDKVLKYNLNTVGKSKKRLKGEVPSTKENHKMCPDLSCQISFHTIISLKPNH